MENINSLRHRGRAKLASGHPRCCWEQQRDKPGVRVQGRKGGGKGKWAKWRMQSQKPRVNQPRNQQADNVPCQMEVRGRDLTKMRATAASWIQKRKNKNKSISFSPLKRKSGSRPLNYCTSLESNLEAGTSETKHWSHYGAIC